MGNRITGCCEPHDGDNLSKRVRSLSNTNEVGGERLSSSITDGVDLPALFGLPPNAPLDVRKRLPEILLKLGKQADSTTSEVSCGISSHASDFTSPTDSVADPRDYTRSGTPVYRDKSEPPALNLRGMFIEKQKKAGKQVSFADFAMVLKEGELFGSTPEEHGLYSPGGGSDEMQLTASPRQPSSSFTPPTPQQLSSSVRSLQSMGEIPSTPSIANIYYQNHQETKANFYTQPTKQPELQQLDKMYIESSLGCKASLVVPSNRMSVGTLPPSPILDELFLSEEQACKISFDEYKSSLGIEQTNGRTVLWGDVSDSESSEASLANTTTEDSFDEFCSFEKIEESTFDETSSCVGGAMISKAWFTAAEEPYSPDSFAEFSYGGGCLLE